MFWDKSEEINNEGTNSVTVSNSIRLDHDDLAYLLYFIAFVKLIELLFVIYKAVQHKVKKRYTNNVQL